MQRMTLRLALTSLMACGALALGCGDSGGGTVVTPDASETDASVDTAVDAAPDAAPDTAEDTTPDTPQPVDAPDDTTTMDVPVDMAPVDVPVDMAPIDVPVDMAPVDVPVDMGVDASVDAPMDVPVDMPPDMPPVDVPMDMPVVDAGVNGHPASSLVGAGGVMRSPSYRMVSTLGQSTIHQTVMRSTGFRLQGGVVGASGGSR